MSVTQKEGVFHAVLALCEESGLTFEQGQKFTPTKDQRKVLVSMIAEAIYAGEIQMSDEAKSKYDTIEKLKTDYVNGLLTNWLNKDTRLNGGEKHAIKNPGSRAGQGNPALKELSKLKVVNEGNEEALAAIDEEIARVKAETAKTKTAKIIIDETRVPESLKKFIK